MNAEFEKVIKSLPSHFEVQANERKFGDDALLGLGNNTENLVATALERGYIVISNPFSEKGELGKDELWIKSSEQHWSLSECEVIDFGDDGLYVWEKKAPRLRALLLGKEAPSDTDLIKFFESRVEKGKNFEIVGLNDANFGDFVEQYEYTTQFLDIDNTAETNHFFGETNPVLLEQELYFGLDKYLRSKRILRENELIDPIAYYSSREGRVILSTESEDKYFNQYLKFSRDAGEENDVLGVKDVQYNK